MAVYNINDKKDLSIFADVPDTDITMPEGENWDKL